MSMLFTLLRKFHEEMKRRSLEYVIVDGAVIGWWRNRTMIPHDHDIDFLVSEKVWASSAFIEVLEELAASDKMYSAKFVEANKLKISFGTATSGLDIWEAKVDSGYVYNNYKGYCNTHSVENVFPVQTVIFGGVEVYFPHNVEGYLDECYGKDKWQVPDV